MKNYVYLVYHHKTALVKIGRTQNPEQRLKSLQTANTHLDGCFFMEGHIYIESLLHMYFEPYRKMNEWFVMENLIPNQINCHSPFFYFENIDDYNIYKDIVLKEWTKVASLLCDYFESVGVFSDDKIKVNYKSRYNKRDRLIDLAYGYLLGKLYPNNEGTVIQEGTFKDSDYE